MNAMPAGGRRLETLDCAVAGGVLANFTVEVQLLAALGLVLFRRGQAAPTPVHFRRGASVLRLEIEIAADDTLQSLAERVAGLLQGTSLQLAPAEAAGPLVVAGEPASGDTWTLSMHQGRLRCAFDPAFHRRDECEVLLAHVSRALAASGAQATAPISELSLTSEEEMERLLTEWNRTERPHDLEQTVPDLIRSKSFDRPDAPAVWFDGQTLTYAELRRESERIARLLAARGAGPKQLIGIMVTPSLQLPALLLGVLQSGAAYLPLDPSYPIERLAFMVEDARPLMVLTGPGVDASGIADKVTTVSLDVLAATPDPGPNVTLPKLSRDELAYVIYTSGSTGKPKGVLIEHAGFTNLVLSMAERLGFGAGDRMLATCSLSFDISVEELFLPLANGGSVALCPRGTVADGMLLRAELERSHANFLNTTPSSYRLLTMAGWEPDERWTLVTAANQFPLS